MKAALQAGRELFANSDSPRMDAEILLMAVLGKPREYLYTWPEQELTTAQQDAFAGYCRRRAQGTPIAYLTGRRWFWNFELKINARVLIPRPETELLVEATLEVLQGVGQARVADLGTGSGAIALALASERPDWQIVACDKSLEALALARENCQALRAGNVSLRAGNWCEALGSTGQWTALDALVANPPYIGADDPHLELGDVRFEPRQALVAAAAGLADIALLVADSRACLRPEGWLLLEHGFEQGEAVRSLLWQQGYAGIETRRDLSGHERLTLAQWPGRA
ncbi:MAG: peptide chain release factor N(5)-glutamine methyltransferase [Pseudomonadales bacterium]|nr:peptide chain release factor N(5)-glutamine methyltransferase [Pseudomonadales bacterium]